MAQASSAQREPSMEEILASIRRIIEDSDQAGRKSGESLKRFDDLSGLSGREAVEASSMRTAPREGAEPDFIGLDAAAPSDADASRAASKQAFAADRVDLEDEKVSGEESTTTGEAGGTIGAPASAHPLFGISRPNIMSEEPGRQVGAAFGRLSEAFTASRRKNLDEVAEEILRPMLQNWLDNNLPALVERLVREEIERMARSS